MVPAGLYFLGALSTLLGKRFQRVPFILAASAGGIGVAVALYALAGGLGLKLHFESAIPFAGLDLLMDPLSAFFLLVISLLSLAVSVYSLDYSKDTLAGLLHNLFLLSMVLLVAANTAFLFLVLWEAMSLVSYFLVVHDHENREAREAGFLYIVMAHLGTALITLSFLVFYKYSGSFSFDAFRTAGPQMPALYRNAAFLLALVGFGVKAGIVPLHVWLPYAHPAAPSSASALMSGVMIKTAIYGFLRVALDFLGPGPLWWGLLVLAVASATALLGVMYALVEQDIKRLLAYSSVENVGIILMGVGVGMVFAAAGDKRLAALGLLAGLYHLINHAAFKGLLFLCAGSVVHSTRTKNIEELGGLIKRMPYTSLFFLVGAIAISALPPLNGFVSEWLTFQALLPALGLGGAAGIGAILVGAILALSAGLAAACFVKAFGITFLALPRSDRAERAEEAPFWMLSGMGLLALACLLLGVLAPFLIPLLAPVTEGLVGGAVPARGPAIALGYGSLSTPAMGGLILLLVPLPILIAMAYGMGRSRVSETWGCGLKTLTSRMEYSAAAFSNPLRTVFATVYRPRGRVVATYGASRYFKGAMRADTRVEPLFEQRLYAPIATFLVMIAYQVKRIQTGSIHAYITYIFATLILLLASWRWL